MGHAASAVVPATSCCQEDQAARFPIELDVDCERARGSEDSPTACRLQCEPRDGQFRGAERIQSDEHPWGCCRAFGEPSETEGGLPQALESLSYMPMRFDEGPTVDPERSDARYSKIVVHSTRARTQKRSKAWEDWVRAAIAGRAVTLLRETKQGGDLKGDGGHAQGAGPTFERVPAMYHLDRTLCRFLLLPVRGVEMSPIAITIETIQVICPASDFLLFFDQVDSVLDEAEKRRAVMIQYVTDDSAGERRRICFLEESDTSKDTFVQSLTALWLEKRNDHSMWF